MDMKKATALLCAVSVTLCGAATTAFAAPSISSVNTATTQTTSASSEYTSEIFRGKAIKVIAATVEHYKDTNAKIANVIEMLQDAAQTHTTKDLLEAVGVTFTAGKEFKTVDGIAIDPTEYEPVTKMSTFTYEDGKLLEDGKIEIEVPNCEALVGVEKEDVVVVQLDDEVLTEEAAEDEGVYFIQPKELDSKTGSFTAQFPCTGPFFVTAKVAK